MPSFAALGNDLYTGRRSIDFVGRRRLWYPIAVVLVLASVALLLTRGLNEGIEFTGGSEFRVTGVVDADTAVAERTVLEVVPDAQPPRASAVGDDGVRVQTEQLDPAQTDRVGAALAEAYDVTAGDVSTSFVGPTWGGDVSEKALRGLVVFLVLVSIVIAAYFRTWKMALAALVALVHDVVLTAGVYSLSGFEVTPATVIGFLTILGYSLYDTVVVFDKVRENTEHVLSSSSRTYAEACNLAVNQTLVRSINTTVVALLPVAAILFIGAFVLGAGTLRDIALSLFVGMLAGAYSSIFIATPLYVQLREREAPVRAHTERVLARRAGGVPPSPRRGGSTRMGAPGAPGGAALAGAASATAVLDREDVPDDGTGGGAGTPRTGASRTGAPRTGATGAVPTGPARHATRGQRTQPVRRPSGRRK